MTEFWFEPSLDRKVLGRLGWDRWEGPGGRRHNIIEAEAFTSGPPSCNWTESADPDIRYFSGTAVYRCNVECAKGKVGKETILSLGDCNNQIAKVVLNGRAYDPVWCAPDVSIAASRFAARRFMPSDRSRAMPETPPLI